MSRRQSKIRHASDGRRWDLMVGLALYVAGSCTTAMFPSNSAGLEESELPLRLGLIFDTTLVATRLIYSGIFCV
jgi:hypothetical protein